MSATAITTGQVARGLVGRGRLLIGTLGVVGGVAVVFAAIIAVSRSLEG